MSTTVENPSRSDKRKRLNERIGATVKALVKARGMTNRELGDRIGQPETTMSKLIKGRQTWGPDDLYGAARALEVDLGLLWESPYTALVEIGFNQEAALKLLGGIGVDPGEPGGDKTGGWAARDSNPEPAESMPEAA